MKQIFAAVLSLMVAAPASAFDRMARQDCIDAFLDLAELMDPGEQVSNPRTLARAQTVTPDGWCRIRGRAVVPSVEFDELDWRAEGITRWTRDGIPPLALEMRVTGLDPDSMQGGDVNTLRPSLSAEMTIRQLPEAGQLIVERAELSNGRGDVLAGSAAFDRVYLSSPSMAQVSIGSIALKGALLQMSLTGELENPFGFGGTLWVDGTEAARRQAGFDLIEALPEGVSNDATRAELSEFAAALPRPVGRLEVSVASEVGLGLMQMGAAMASQIAPGQMDRSVLEIMFNGVTLAADWAPGEGQSD